MKNIIILFLSFIFLTSTAQNFGTIYTTSYWTMKNTQKEIDKEIKKGEEVRNFTSTKTVANDTLTYLISDSIDGFTMKYSFNLKYEWDKQSYCDFQEIIFDCTPCSQKHLKEYLIDKDYSFRKISENKYLTKYSWKTEMTVEYKSSNKGCLILKFRYVSRPKKEYKKYYDSLEQP